MGSKTYGKPSFNYLFNYKPKDEKEFGFYLTLGVEANARGEGDFFDGIPATFSTLDDATRDFGDKRETSLAEALSVITTGAPSFGRVEGTENTPAINIGANPAWNIVSIQK
jgi:carboxyl-terminal processing protease